MSNKVVIEIEADPLQVKWTIRVNGKLIAVRRSWGTTIDIADAIFESFKVAGIAAEKKGFKK